MRCTPKAMRWLLRHPLPSVSLLATPKSSISASSLGLSVVQRFTWLATWNVQRWMRVVGQTAFAALEKAGRAIGDDHLGRRDSEHERLPCRGRLGSGEVPSDYVSVGDRYEHDRLPAQPDAVQKHDVVDLPGKRRYRPKLPYPGGLPPKRSSARRKVGYRVFGERPSEKRSQRFGAAVLFLRTLEAPHFGHRQRLVPAFVVPLPFILEPQTWHFGLFTLASCPSATFYGKNLA